MPCFVLCCSPVFSFCSGSRLSIIAPMAKLVSMDTLCLVQGISMRYALFSDLSWHVFLLISWPMDGIFFVQSLGVASGSRAAIWHDNAHCRALFWHRVVSVSNVE